MTLLKHAGSCLLAVLLGVSVPVAQAAAPVPQVAAPFTTLPGSVVAPVGGQAMPTMSFTFDAPFALTGFSLNLDYVPEQMTFNAGASTLSSGGNVATLLEALTELQGASTPDDFFGIPPTDNPGAYSLSAFYFAGHYPVAAQTVVFTAVFDLLPAFTAGTHSDVTFSGSLENTAFESHPFGGVATVTAVPEPETWLMLIGGLGLLAHRVRRRRQ